MAWKSILVHVDEGAGRDARIALAAYIAKQCDAQISGALVVAPLELPQKLRSHAGVRRLLESEWRKAKAAAATQASAFAATAATAGFARARAQVLEGDPAACLAAAARGHDLLVLAQPDSEDLGALGNHFAERVLLEAGRPVLVVPRGKRMARAGRRVLVAWKDTQASAAALKDALPLLRVATEVSVLTVGENAKAAGGDEARDYLARQGIKAKVAQTRGADAGLAILRQARALGCDLIVMGAYARTRLTELVLGGATRTVLERMTVPVLMSH